MKKALLMLTILLIAVVSTACINNLAIQELNNKAKAYLEAGEPEKAVCRLKSGLDLDNNFFETNYNLAIAYIALKDFDNAKDALEHAININPDYADSYYTLGNIYENIADLKAQGEKDNTDDNSDIELVEPKKPAEVDSEEIVADYKSALDAYTKYLSMTADVKSKEETEKIIENLNNQIRKYTGEETLD